jgi:hypothetical protein
MKKEGKKRAHMYTMTRGLEKERKREINERPSKLIKRWREGQGALTKGRESSR